ncbi:MAG: hypothetical protein M3P18_26795, partial [Actinomycetota bacterium]|nr:hypothetical protein [Actinomycetota bacterium]
ETTGVPRETIRKMVGQHSREFTADTYVHLNDNDDSPDGAIVSDLNLGIIQYVPTSPSRSRSMIFEHNAKR